MAKELTPEEKAAQEEKKRLQEEKKKLKKEQAQQKKEAKKRAKEIAKQEEELESDEDTGGFVTFIATVFIVLLWLAVIVVIIKLDVGGFGSGVLAPVLKNVPVINRILPSGTTTETLDPDMYGGYTNLQDAVSRIYALETELEAVKGASAVKDERIAALEAEVTRLSEFETMQVDFQRIRNEFYEEVIYAENGPGAEEYARYYETMDPTTAEFIYKQVVEELQVSKEIQDYVQAYSSMKPKEAAALFEKMTDTEGIQLAARILGAMNPEDRAKIFNEMDKDIAARITKILDPES
jgi:flagellar motility protein MotE (MotC chaperone)